MYYSYPINYPEMVVKKSEGLTDSEKKLISLGYNTFLHLWSFPNPYKKQSGGKELCDLLIVFGDSIIIFSDKDCVYGNSGNERTDWIRWYKKAIKKSAEQLIGAKKWIENYPDKITLDAKGSVPFPLRIDITQNTKFYLVAVAHGASERCRQFYEGSDGGLIIDSSITFDLHTTENCTPFWIGHVSSDPDCFIHVFDDESYTTVLRELDTIVDFLGYLDGREKLLKRKTVIATSENELLAQHLTGIMRNNAQTLHGLSETEYTQISFEEGLWDELIISSQYKMWRNSLKKSYFWDSLLQKTFFFIENGMSEGTTSPSIQAQSELFYILGRENRTQRLSLSEAFLSFLESMPPNFRGTRIIYSESEPDVCYVLLLLPYNHDESYEEYRKMRREMLQDYCLIAKTDFPNVEQVIGVAHESAETGPSTEDFLCMDTREWSEQDQENAITLKLNYKKYNFLGERKYIHNTQQLIPSSVKGRDRNKPCPCGSGKKYKKCCGKHK